MSQGPMSHVEFKKQPCRPVEFRGQGPYIGRVPSTKAWLLDHTFCQNAVTSSANPRLLVEPTPSFLDRAKATSSSLPIHDLYTNHTNCDKCCCPWAFPHVLITSVWSGKPQLSVASRRLPVAFSRIPNLILSKKKLDPDSTWAR